MSLSQIPDLARVSYTSHLRPAIAIVSYTSHIHISSIDKNAYLDWSSGAAGRGSRRRLRGYKSGIFGNYPESDGVSEPGVPITPLNRGVPQFPINMSQSDGLSRARPPPSALACGGSA